jgi:hypothetical protein
MPEWRAETMLKRTYDVKQCECWDNLKHVSTCPRYFGASWRAPRLLRRVIHTRGKNLRLFYADGGQVDLNLHGGGNDTTEEVVRLLDLGTVKPFEEGYIT